MLKKYFSTSISKKQSSDTGMAMVLILLIIAMLTENNIYLLISIFALIVNMTFPTFYYPVAIIWLGFSHLLGTVISKILLSVVFVLMVVPVGLLRRLLGKDSLKLTQFKRSNSSVMKKRNYSFISKDIQKPF